MYFTHATLASGACVGSPEEAATTFIMWSVDSPQRAVELIPPDDLKLFRSRLQQVMDDRYSPDSAVLREQWLGSEWSQERISTASDAELVGRYFLGDGRRRQSTRISEVRAVESRRVPFADREIVVTYVVEEAARRTAGRQEFSANQVGGCWYVQLTAAAWGRLEEVAKILKGSRKQATVPRQGPARLNLQLAAASRTAAVGMRQMTDVGEGAGVWIASTPLLTQDDVIGAAAVWDCEPAGFGPEAPAVRLNFSPQGADVLRRWTEANIDSLLAVVVDSQVVTVARVTTALGPRLLFCLQGRSLEEAHLVVSDLMGSQPPEVR